MSLTETVVEGTLKSDGTLELDQKPNLPAGRVTVIVQTLPDLPDGDPFWDMMKSIWAGQKARGHVARSAEEVEAERARRGKVGKSGNELEQLQEQSRHLREHQP